jgi:spore coat polysaccharide biosynthesis protein SpsF
MTGIFLQVRLGSKRLPGKALLPLINGNVIQHAMRALREVPAEVYALVTDEQSSPELQPFAQKEGFIVFTGPEDDVLARYCQAARFFRVKKVIRATGDNPLVSPRLAREILMIHEKKNPDLSHYINMPLGTGVEVVESEALFEVEKNVKDPFEKEHLTTHIYRNRETYTLLEVPCPDDCYLPDIHVSIDTPGDYSLILELYKDLYNNQPVETNRVVEWLKENEKRIDQLREKNTLCPGNKR